MSLDRDSATGRLAVSTFGAAQTPAKLRPQVEAALARLDALRANPRATTADLWEWAGSTSFLLGYLLGAVEGLAPVPIERHEEPWEYLRLIDLRSHPGR